MPVPPKPVEKPAPPKPAPPKVAKKPVVSIDASSTRRKPAPVETPKNAGASRLGDDFKKGLGDKPDANAPLPASQIGSSEKASLVQAVARQLKPYWRQPSGVDVDKLVTVIEWDLNPDGTPQRCAALRQPDRRGRFEQAAAAVASRGSDPGDPPGCAVRFAA